MHTVIFANIRYYSFRYKCPIKAHRQQTACREPGSTRKQGTYLKQPIKSAFQSAPRNVVRPGEDYAFACPHLHDCLTAKWRKAANARKACNVCPEAG